MSRISGLFAVVAAMALSSMARADVWDDQTQNDNSVASENELIHGSDQLHDLAALPGPALDQDFFRVSQRPYSSYEAVVDATSGDIGTTLNLDRTDAGGAPSSRPRRLALGSRDRSASSTTPRLPTTPTDSRSRAARARRRARRTTSTGSGSTRRRIRSPASTTPGARSPSSSCRTRRATPSPAPSGSGFRTAP